jgi:hypothetical protein
VWASQRWEEECEEMDEEGGATRVELRVTASFRIFSASFQCTVSTNLDTARSMSKNAYVIFEVGLKNPVADGAKLN